MKLVNNLKFDLRQAIRMRLENLGSDPTFSSSEHGRLWFNSAAKKLGFNNGTDVVHVRDTGTPIVNGDISSSAGISISKLEQDPRARANHTGTQTAATISNFDSQVRTSRLDQMAAPAEPVSMNSQQLTNVANPTSAQSAATKAYVDNMVQGLNPKEEVRVATTANINLASPGASINGVTMSAGDRVLVKNQTTASQNGIYAWNGSDTAMTRTSDADTWSELISAYVFVEQGSTLADTLWVCTADRGGTLGTTAVTWGQIGGPSEITASQGLVKVANDIRIVDEGVTDAKLANGSVRAAKLHDNVLDRLPGGNTQGIGFFDMKTGGTPGLALKVDSAMFAFGVGGPDARGYNVAPLQIKDGGISADKLADSAVDVTSAKVTGVLPIIKGGTGAATASEARSALGVVGKYSSATHAAGASISIPAATHGLGTGQDKLVQTQIAATGEVVYADVTVETDGDVIVSFDTTQAANTIRVTVIG